MREVTLPFSYRADSSFTAVRKAVSVLDLGAASLSTRSASAVFRPFLARSHGPLWTDEEGEGEELLVNPEDQGKGATCWLRASLRHTEAQTKSRKLSVAWSLFCFRVIVYMCLKRFHSQSLTR